MIIRPRIRGFICTTAHPDGCARAVQDQIEWVTSQAPFDGPKKVLVVGASTGYGLASRIATMLADDVYWLKSSSTCEILSRCSSIRMKRTNPSKLRREANGAKNRNSAIRQK